VSSLELLANLLRVVGLFVLIPGLWFAAGGMRVVVSGRIDERRKSAKSLKLGLPLILVGAILLFGGTWLANWAHLQ
jgi:hypothetical protein